MTVNASGLVWANASAKLRNDAGPDASRPMRSTVALGGASGKLVDGPRYSLRTAARSTLSACGSMIGNSSMPMPIFAGVVSIAAFTGGGFSSGSSGVSTTVVGGSGAFTGGFSSFFTGVRPPNNSANPSTSPSTPTDPAVAYIQIGEFAGFLGASSSAISTVSSSISTSASRVSDAGRWRTTLSTDGGFLALAGWIGAARCFRPLASRSQSRLSVVRSACAAGHCRVCRRPALACYSAPPGRDVRDRLTTPPAFDSGPPAASPASG